MMTWGHWGFYQRPCPLPLSAICYLASWSLPGVSRAALCVYRDVAAYDDRSAGELVSIESSCFTHLGLASLIASGAR